ncbi:Thioredoxin domain-containing protein [Meloidogyne graminicola]|uniref:Thioredoxin domain-containing protein n=1 Tax=Meloidogyne graminicola TaxID=189291 RepID=A0A8S9ZHI4_9BILA|nr:Thioredoxin domain-containing protein [Meloidogyne graminicola]KAF7632810.1 Thioredoxin domain-containing protein [Meloidogyne graminicola]
MFNISSFEHSIVSKLPFSKNFTESNQTKQETFTIGELIRSCNYLLFYVFSSFTIPNPLFIQSLQQLITSRKKDVKKKINKSSPAKLKRLFGLGKKGSTENVSLAFTDIKVVVIDVEFNLDEINLPIDSLELFFFLNQNYLYKSRLLRALNFVTAPSLFILDCSELKIISQAYTSLINDQNCENFPWQFTPPNELLKGNLLKNTNDGSFESVEFDKIGKGVKGLFFGAKWCPPSKQMLKQLTEIYPKIKEQNPYFEIIFCSYDRSEDSFKEHFGRMPWLSLPYGTEKQLANTFDIQGIPTFLLLDEDFSLISRNGRNVLLSDPQGYPWKRKPLYELNEHTVHRLSEMTSLTLFTDGSPEDTEFSIQLLNTLLEEQQNELTKNTSKADLMSINSENVFSFGIDPLQIFYTGDDPICDDVLENLGLEDADLPLLLICDVLSGHLAICDKPDVSEDILREFVEEYKNGKSKVIAIPNNKKEIKNRTVAGIPAEMLEQLLNNSTITNT